MLLMMLCTGYCYSMHSYIQDGLDAYTAWMRNEELNMANQNTTRSVNGEAYVPQIVKFEEYTDKEGMKRLRSVVVNDSNPYVERHQPGHPHADPKTGMVHYPNINPVQTMVNHQQAARAISVLLAMSRQDLELKKQALRLGKN